MKLHLGSGKRKIPGWINVDIDPANEPDRVDDIFAPFLSTWPAGTVEVIYACHVLEHAGRHLYKEVLAYWHGLLKPGGILRLSVPDLGAVFERHQEGKSKVSELLGFLYGGQRNEYDYHKMGWDYKSLKADLLEAGFKDVRRYDRWATEHADVDDYSASYLPKLQDCKGMEEYRQGQLLSLNVEASK